MSSLLHSVSLQTNLLWFKWEKIITWVEIAAISSWTSCWWSLVGIGLKFEIREFGRVDPLSLIGWKANWACTLVAYSLKSKCNKLISGWYGGITDGLRDFCASLDIFDETTNLLSRWTTIRIRLVADRNNVCASIFRMSRAS